MSMKLVILYFSLFYTYKNLNKLICSIDEALEVSTKKNTSFDTPKHFDTPPNDVNNRGN